MEMDGIQYVTNKKGERTAVIIDLKKYSELWEDFYDSLVMRSREGGPEAPIAEVEKRLRQKGKLDA